MLENIGQIGEKALLQRLKSYLGTSRDLIRIFSEDCAVIDTPGDFYQLFTVDAMVEGVHFRREYATGYDIGRKAIKVNLSDIAAMAGEALYFLISFGAPPQTPLRMIDEIYKGIASVSQQANTLLIGGNVSSAPFLFLDITIIGRVQKQKVTLRKGAKIGDAIFVTGPLGASAEGLRLLEEGYRLTDDSKTVPVRDCIAAHLDPPFLIPFAQRLAASAEIHAMIDLSDGLAADLREICRESEVGARLELNKIPVAPCLNYWAKQRNADPVQVALKGGEDYHLLFTAPIEQRSTLLAVAKEHGAELSEIGAIVDATTGIRCADEKGHESELLKGFEHFQ